MQANNREIVNARILYYMSIKDISIANLSEQMGVSNQVASQLVRCTKGVKSYRFSTIEKLAKIFNVELFDMLKPLPTNIDLNLLKPPDGRRKQKKI